MRKNIKEFECLNCGESFFRHSKISTGKFCSSKCSGEHRYKITLESNLEKMINNTIHHNCRLAMKNVLIDKLDIENKCCICGIDEWMGKPLPLILDHIDGNAYNNIPENLRLVCSNCDSQLDTYKKKNKLGRQRRAKVALIGRATLL